MGRHKAKDNLKELANRINASYAKHLDRKLTEEEQLDRDAAALIVDYFRVLIEIDDRMRSEEGN